MTTDHSESTAFAESLTQNPYVLSPWNLTGFIIWARTADEDDIDQAIGAGLHRRSLQPKVSVWRTAGHHREARPRQGVDDVALGLH